VTGNEWNLWSTLDSQDPYLLSKGGEELSGNINEVALTNEYLTFMLTDKGLPTIQVYSLDNLYAPSFVNRIENLRGYDLANIHVSRDIVLAQKQNSIFMGYVRGRELEQISLTDTPIDVVYDEDAMYLLYNNRVELRAVENPEIVLESKLHTVTNAQKIVLDKQRLAITNEDEIELLNIDEFKSGGTNPLIGKAYVELGDLALSGELLVMHSPGERHIKVYDLNLIGQNIKFDYLTQIAIESDTISCLSIHGSLVEWCNQGVYFSVNLPFNNIWSLSPSKISSNVETISLAVSGPTNNWDDMSVFVKPRSTGLPLPGMNRLVGTQLNFDVIGSNYSLGEIYDVDLPTNPDNSIDGAEVNIDLPWQITTEQLFGLSPLNLRSITPSDVLTDQPVTYIIKGQQLNLIDQLTFGGENIDLNTLTTNEAGTEISFTHALSNPGFVSLQASQLNGAQSDALPAAVFVTQSIEIASIQTDNTKGGPSALSDSGNNKITVSGLGLNGNLSVHLIAYQNGEYLSDINKLAYKFIDGNLVINKSPKTLSGKQYQLVIERAATSELVYAQELLLLNAIDDTAPSLEITSPLGKTQEFKLTFNEAVEADSFSVIKTFKDFTSTPDSDISSRFELVNLTDKILAVRLRNGQSLENNASYIVTLNGVIDLAGNLETTNNGTFKNTFVALDTLPPRNLSIVRASDGAPVNLAMLLTRGREYTFDVVAEDNYVSVSKLKFTYRESTAWNAATTPVLAISSSSLKLSRKILEEFDYYEISLTTKDIAGNSISQAFKADLRDPLVELENFFTNPIEPEEAVRAQIHFDLLGDVDMVTAAMMNVDKIQKGQAISVFNSYSKADGTVKGSFINPKIKDLLPKDSTPVPVQMTARLLVEYGFSSSKVFDQDYTLYLDRTPPTLQIVSPENGDYIPIGERTDILLQSFDKYGIEKVEVSKNGAAYETLEDSNRYSFTATVDDFLNGVSISAIASDPNGNVSPVANMTLYPFDPEQGAPKLEIISPENGKTFHEGQPVIFEVQMRNVPDAKLYLDVGGIEAPEESGILLELPQDGSERQFVTANIPSVNEDIVVLARIQKGNVMGYKFLNAINDEGIDENADISIQPAATILTGTQISISSDIPTDMQDFNSDSFIRVMDPTESITPIDIPMGKSQRVMIGTEGTNVTVRSVLKDLSGNERTQDSGLAKISYFTSISPETVLSANQASEEIAGMDYLPGMLNDESLIVAFNNRNGGFRLQSGTLLLAQHASGKVQFLSANGTGLVVQTQSQGQSELLHFPLEAGSLGVEQRYTLSGQVIGTEGKLLWLRQGDFITANFINETQLLPVAGIPLNEPVLYQQVVADKLYVLTGSGLYRFGVKNDTVPTVKQELFVSLPDQHGFVSNGEDLTTWSGDKISMYRFLNDDSLVSLHSLEKLATDQVMQARLDDEISWLRVVHNDQTIDWEAYLNGELVALLPEPSEHAVFTSGALYTVGIQDNLSVVKQRDIAIESGATAFLTTVEMEPFGLNVSASSNTDILGMSTISFQQHGVLLPSIERINDGQKQWFIPYTAIDSSEITASYKDHSVVLTDSFTASFSSFTDVLDISPIDGATLTKGATVPVVTIVSELARVNEQAINAGSENNLMPILTSSNAYQWISLSKQNNSDSFTHMINASPSSIHNINLIDNQNESASVLILSPENDAPAYEGDWLKLSFIAENLAGGEFKYAEVILEDFNREIVSRTLVNDESAELNIKVPSVDNRDTFYLRVRAYYDNEYRYSEKEISISVIPRSQVPNPVISGITSSVFVGSTVHYQLNSDNLNGYSSTLNVHDEFDNLLASSDMELTLVVPENITTLLVSSQVKDEFDNTKQTEHHVNVVTGMSPHSSSPFISFDVMLADGAEAWFATGRELRNKAADIMVVLDADITAMGRLGDRLLIALDDNRFVVVDPAENYQVVASHPLSGTVSDLAIGFDRIIAIVDGELFSYTVSGNTISDASLRQASNTPFINDQPVYDVRYHAGQFEVLRADVYLSFDKSGLTNSAKWIELDSPTAMSRLGQYVYITTESGMMYSIDSKNQIWQARKAGVFAEKLINYGQYLVALSFRSQQVQYIDVLNGRYVEKVGQFELPFNIDIKDLINGKAGLYGGKVFLADGNTLVLGQIDAPLSSLYASENARGYATDIAIDNGMIGVAAGSFGAQFIEYQQGQWSSQSYPEERNTVGSNAVAIDNGQLFISQADRKVVIALDISSKSVTSSIEKMVFSEFSATTITTTPTKVVAAEGNKVHLASRTNYTLQGSIDLPVGEIIVDMINHGETLYVATDNRRLYRIVSGPLPLDTFLIDVEPLLDGSTDIIQNMAVSGDELFFNIGTTLHKLNLNTYVDTVLDIIDVVNINAITYGNGHVWLAYSTSSSVQIVPIDIPTWTIVSGVSHSVNSLVTNMDIDKGILAIAKGDAGIEVLQIGGDLYQNTASLIEPVSNTVYVQGDVLTLSLTETDNVNSVSYFINGNIVAGSNEAPFTLETLVPPSLRNGQPFFVNAAIETTQGEIVLSGNREVLLQGEDLPGNTFNVRLIHPQLGVATYIPKPLEIRAAIINSSEPIYQVEYYESESDNPSGPYKLIGKHYGPEFVIFREYGLDDSGKYIKLRAVDIYGNLTASEPVPVTRLEDNNPPQVSSFNIDGPTQSENEIIAEHNFVISSVVSDAESGIESAILRRNDVIIAAIFEKGTIAFTETTAQVDQQLTYTLTVKDKAGNVSSLSKTYTIVEDKFPAIEEFVSSTPTIIEKGRLTLSYRVSDAVGVSQIEVLWNGFSQVENISPLKLSAAKTMTIRDMRTERVTEGFTDTLTLRVTDDIGQVTSQDIVIPVIIDQVPDASRLEVTYPSNEFYGNNITISIGQLQQANDGTDKVSLEIIETLGNEEKVVYSSDVQPKDLSKVYNAKLQLPDSEIADNNYRFKVRISDHLGQSSETQDFAIALTRYPNELQFYELADQTNYNPSAFTVGDTVMYQVAVLDSASRPVPNQLIQWSLVADVGDDIVDLGSVTSNTDGLAALAFNSVQKAGLHKLIAKLELPNSKIIKKIRVIQIYAGDTVEVRAAHIDVIQAGEVFNINLQAYDEGGNQVPADSSTSLDIVLPFSGFHFEFSSNASSQVLEAGGEKATVTLQNGQANLEVSAANIANTYIAALSINDAPEVETSYSLNGNDQAAVTTSTINLNVISNKPHQVTLHEVSRINHPLGEEERLEAGEEVTISAILKDKYGNHVQYLDPYGNKHDADMPISITVDGSAQLTDVSEQNTLDLVRGYGEYKVSDEQVEKVTTSVIAVHDLVPNTVAKLSSLDLDFLKRKPNIDKHSFDQTVNSIITPITFNYTESLSFSGEANMAEFSLQGEAVSGTFELLDDIDNKPTQLRFTPSDRLALDTCYQLETENSSLTGLAANDSVLEQSIEVCTATAIIQIPQNRYGLANSAVAIAVDYADGFDLLPYLGKLAIERVTAEDPFTTIEHSQADVSFGAEVVTLPTFVEDGVVVSLQLIAFNKETGIPCDGSICGKNGIVGAGGEQFRSANMATYTVLTASGDFDNDGIPNAEEIRLGLNPLLTDSDGNGIADGDEDYDNDGLTNAQEIAFNSALDNPDTDGDGLSDYNEFANNGNPNSEDTDGDGIPDLVEFASDSQIDSEYDRFVSADYVTEIFVTPTLINHKLGEGVTNYDLSVSVMFEYENRSFLLPANSLFESHEMGLASQDETVVTVESYPIPVATIQQDGNTNIEILFYQNTVLNKFVAVTVLPAKPKPVIDSYSFDQNLNSLITPITFNYSESLALAGDGNMAEFSLQGEAVSGTFELLDDNDNKPTQLRFTPSEMLALNTCYHLETANSSLTGIAENDSVLEQSIEVCTSPAILQIPEYRYGLADSTLAIAVDYADGFDLLPYLGKLAIEHVTVEEPFTTIEHSQVDVSFGAEVVTLPTFVEDGVVVSLQLIAFNKETGISGDGSIGGKNGIVGAGGEQFRSANMATYTVLTASGDLDNDGIPNAEEIRLGLNPLLTDSDGNGIADGDEDYDNDGLTNAQEIAFNSALDNPDTDGDGLSDYNEFANNGNPNSEDTDGDGIPDLVEFASDTQIDSEYDRFISADYVTEIFVTPTHINHNIGEGDTNYDLSVSVMFEYENRSFLLPADSLFESHKMGLVSQDETVVTVSSYPIPVATIQQDGNTNIEILFYQNTALNKVVAVTVLPAALLPSIRSVTTFPTQMLYTGTDFTMYAIEIESDVPFELNGFAMDFDPETEGLESFVEESSLEECIQWEWGGEGICGQPLFILDPATTVDSDNASPFAHRYLLVFPKGLNSFSGFTGQLEASFDVSENVSADQVTDAHRNYTTTMLMSWAQDPDPIVYFSGILSLNDGRENVAFTVYIPPEDGNFEQIPEQIDLNQGCCWSETPTYIPEEESLDLKLQAIDAGFDNISIELLVDDAPAMTDDPNCTTGDCAQVPVVVNFERVINWPEYTYSYRVNRTGYYVPQPGEQSTLSLRVSELGGSSWTVMGPTVIAEDIPKVLQVEVITPEKSFSASIYNRIIGSEFDGIESLLLSSTSEDPLLSSLLNAFVSGAESSGTKYEPNPALAFKAIGINPIEYVKVFNQVIDEQTGLNQEVDDETINFVTNDGVNYTFTGDHQNLDNYANNDEILGLSIKQLGTPLSTQNQTTISYAYRENLQPSLSWLNPVVSVIQGGNAFVNISVTDTARDLAIAGVIAMDDSLNMELLGYYSLFNGNTFYLSDDEIITISVPITAPLFEGNYSLSIIAYDAVGNRTILSGGILSVTPPRAPQLPDKLLQPPIEVIRELMAPEISFVIYKVKFDHSSGYNFILNGCGNFTPKLMLFRENYGFVGPSSDSNQYVYTDETIYVVVADSHAIDSYIEDHIAALVAGIEPPIIPTGGAYDYGYDPEQNYCGGDTGRYFDLEVSSYGSGYGSGSGSYTGSGGYGSGLGSVSSSGYGSGY
jgi:hypothetical protein